MADLVPASQGGSVTELRILESTVIPHLGTCATRPFLSTTYVPANLGSEEVQSDQPAAFHLTLVLSLWIKEII